MWIERDYAVKIKAAVKSRPVVLLTGIRQAGKSSLLQRLFSDAEYITLDRILLAEEAEENPTLFLNRFQKQVIIHLPPYYNNLGKRLIKAPKLYFCDNGLAASLLNIHSLEALENSIYMGSIWANFVFSEYLMAGFIAGRDIFFIRDSNAIEIDSVIEKEGKYYLIEAKHTERPVPDKLHLSKIAPLFKTAVNYLAACNIEETGLIALKDFSVYNPLSGSIL
jgi:predicted AAA+ superfamily ATPase